MSLQVRLFQDHPTDAQAWDAYVMHHRRATSDHLWGWRRVLPEAFGYRPYYAGAIEGGRLVGVLPMYRIPRGWGRWALSSIPFGNYGGICADSVEATDALLDFGKTLVAELGCGYLELRHRAPSDRPFLRRKSIYSRFSLPLTADPQAHFRRLRPDTRNKIRKAARKGLQASVSREIDALYPIHLHTTRRLGTPCFPRRYFSRIVEVFGRDVDIYVASLEGRPIAYGLVLRFRGTMVCQFNGSLAAYLTFQPNNFLIWHIIEQGCLQGMSEFDYCRSRMDSGTAVFKRRLNLTEEPLGYEYYLPNGNGLPQRHPSNPRYRWVMQTWQNLPEVMTEALGPAVVRYLA